MRSNYIESVTQQWRKSAPPILSTSHCELYATRSCAHTRKTIPLAPIHSFTKHNVSRIVDLKSFDIHRTSFPHAPYKLLPPNKNILGACHFFFVSSYSFKNFSSPEPTSLSDSLLASLSPLFSHAHVYHHARLFNVTWVVL